MTGKQLQEQGELVQGNCPACGMHTLFLGAGGYVTCSLVDCPMPDAASRLLEKAELDHIVRLEDRHWTAEHPLMERILGTLLDCPIGRFIEDNGGIALAPGIYRVRLDGTQATWTKTT